MDSKHSQGSSPQQAPNPDGGVRSGVKWIVVLIVGLGLVLFAWRPWQRSPGSSGAPAPATGSNLMAKPQPFRPKPKPGEPALAVTDVTPAPNAPITAPVVPAPAPATNPPAASAAVDPVLGGRVKSLRELSGSNAVLTAESVAAWRTNFLQLVQGGPGSVSAIAAFLKENVDYDFSREAWQMLSYPSARFAALDALRQIGGPEAGALMEELLGQSSVPKEVAVLARNLEEAAPGQYREQVLAAARAGLLAAGAAKDSQLDVAPFFEVFQHYGDAGVVADLEKATGQWKYYATMALANLPDGAGIPSLLKMADPAASSGNRLLALEMVAQMAVDNPAMKQVLMTQAANNQIPANYWPYLSSPLTGDQYFPVDSAITQYPALQSQSDLKSTHIRYGNQNLYTLPGDQSLTLEAINQRAALVDELLKSTSDPAALQALQQARQTLEKRGARTAAQPPAATTPTQGSPP